jgi:protein-L-isoaspartate(D-aspartate) O-methyltransferase
MDDTSEVAGRSAKLRLFFARFITAKGGARDKRIETAFAKVPREVFVGPAPWFIFSPVSAGMRRFATTYIETPDDDPAFLYQDSLVGLDPDRGINIGEPSSHAMWLDALSPQPGETVLQVGAGSGYYTAILAELVGQKGHVHAFEIDQAMARRAQDNLALYPWAELHATSGVAEDLPKADAVYVNAGITQPSWAWLDALNPGGRLLFPLQPEGGFGGMLLICKPRDGGLSWAARFVSRAGFIGCDGLQVAQTGRELTEAFAGGEWSRVQSFRLDEHPDESCWFNGGDWWLSTKAPQ